MNSLRTNLLSKYISIVLINIFYSSVCLASKPNIRLNQKNPDRAVCIFCKDGFSVGIQKTDPHLAQAKCTDCSSVYHLGCVENPKKKCVVIGCRGEVKIVDDSIVEGNHSFSAPRVIQIPLQCLTSVEQHAKKVARTIFDNYSNEAPVINWETQDAIGCSAGFDFSYFVKAQTQRRAEQNQANQNRRYPRNQDHLENLKVIGATGLLVGFVFLALAGFIIQNDPELIELKNTVLKLSLIAAPISMLAMAGFLYHNSFLGFFSEAKGVMVNTPDDFSKNLMDVEKNFVNLVLEELQRLKFKYEIPKNGTLFWIAHALRGGNLEDADRFLNSEVQTISDAETIKTIQKLNNPGLNYALQRYELDLSKSLISEEELSLTRRYAVWFYANWACDNYLR